MAQRIEWTKQRGTRARIDRVGVVGMQDDEGSDHGVDLRTFRVHRLCTKSPKNDMRTESVRGPLADCSLDSRHA